jgi:chromosome segregation ATPase
MSILYVIPADLYDGSSDTPISSSPVPESSVTDRPGMHEAGSLDESAITQPIAVLVLNKYNDQVHLNNILETEKLEQYAEIDELWKKITDAQKELTHRHNMYTNSLTSIKGLKAGIEYCNSVIRQKNDEIRSQAESLNDEIRSQAESLKVSVNDLTDLKSKYELLVMTHAQCQSVDNQEKKINCLRKDIIVLEDELDVYNNEAAEFRKTIDTLTKRNDKLCSEHTHNVNTIREMGIKHETTKKKLVDVQLENEALVAKTRNQTVELDAANATNDSHSDVLKLKNTRISHLEHLVQNGRVDTRMYHQKCNDIESMNLEYLNEINALREVNEQLNKRDAEHCHEIAHLKTALTKIEDLYQNAQLAYKANDTAVTSEYYMVGTSSSSSSESYKSSSDDDKTPEEMV